MAVAVVCKETIKEGEKNNFLAHMREMIRLTKLEDGCIAYDLYEPIDGSEGLVMIELWETQEALDRHMKSAHFTSFIPAGDIYKAAPTNVSVYKRA
jgi:quinol monooxygenase YgiN